MYFHHAVIPEYIISRLKTEMFLKLINVLVVYIYWAIICYMYVTQ